MVAERRSIFYLKYFFGTSSASHTGPLLKIASAPHFSSKKRAMVSAGMSAHSAFVMTGVLLPLYTVKVAETGILHMLSIMYASPLDAVHQGKQPACQLPSPGEHD